MAAGDRSRAPAKALAAAIAAARRRAGLALPDPIVAAAEGLRHRVSEWAWAEVAPGRLVPWLPVAFGFGIVGYFTADREPIWWAAAVLALVGIVVAFAARRRAIGFPLALGLAAIAAGFAVATIKAERIADPVLQVPASSVVVAGFVEIREERARSDRVVVAVHRFEGRRVAKTPERIRVAVRKGTAPPVGSFVELKAHLSPPLGPLRPGAYDFARDMYFQRIGASGYALGAIKKWAALGALGAA